MSFFNIGNNRIDTSTSTIAGAKGSIRIPEKATLILVRLIEAEGEIVTYQDLIDAAWDKPVKESALYNQVATLRKALEDNPRKPEYIQTVSKKGYRLVGLPDDSRELPRKPAKKPILAALSLTLLLVLSAYFLDSMQHQQGYAGFANTTQHLRSPDTIVLIEGNNRSGRSEAARSMLRHHLSGHIGTALTVLPKSFSDQNLEALSNHFAASKITSGAAIYSLKTLSTKDGLTLGVTAITGSDKNLDALASIPPAKSVSDLELNLLEIQWLKDRNPVTQVGETPRLAPFNPAPLALEGLLKNSLVTLNSAGDFDIEGELKLYSNLVDVSLQRHPGKYVSHYAAAEYACLLEEYDTCAHELDAALSLQPFDATALKALSWNLLRFSLDEKLTVYFNYLLNPYADTFNLYRDSLLRENLFTEVITRVRAHKLLLSKKSPEWWLVHAQAGTSNEDIPPSLLSGSPSYQVAYNLLDSGFVEQAEQLLKDTSAPFFDKRSLDLQSSLWRGEFSPEEWRSARELAEDRKLHQNTLDKLRIIYFDIYSQDYEVARQGIIELFPQMSTAGFEVTRDNFRLATYYSLALSRAGDQRRARAIAGRQQIFLNNTELGLHDPFWGLSVAEYFAINEDSKSAQASIGELAIAGHRLSNAFWFWPPLSKNIFLRDL